MNLMWEELPHPWYMVWKVIRKIEFHCNAYIIYKYRGNKLYIFKVQ